MFNIKTIFGVILLVALGVGIYAVATTKPDVAVSTTKTNESTTSSKKDTNSVFGTDKNTSNDTISSEKTSPSTSNPLDKDIDGLDKQFDDLNISDL